MRACITVAAVIGMLLVASAALPQEKAPESKAAKEYEKDEFSPFLQALRRGEIILFGSFPISLFLTFEVYDLSRYFANGQKIEYAPWPFRPPNAAAYSAEDTRNVLIAAVSVSLALAVADYVIGRVIAKRAARRSGQSR
jgi:hypothetical protein